MAATVAAAGADSAHSAPSLQPAQFGQPRSGRTLGSTRASLSPSGCHSYTLQTLLSLWFPFITSGWEWPRTLGRRPRGWGRLDLGLALNSLVKGSVWVRRPELDRPDVEALHSRSVVVWKNKKGAGLGSSENPSQCRESSPNFIFNPAHTKGLLNQQECPKETTFAT